MMSWPLNNFSFVFYLIICFSIAFLNADETSAGSDPFLAAGKSVKEDAQGNFDLGTLGYRPYMVAREKRPGSYRILSIGDSYAYGITRGDLAYAAKLVRTLRTASAVDDIEVINLGVPSIGFAEYIAIYNFWSRRLEHDAAVFNVHAGTDFIDADVSLPFRHIGPELAEGSDRLVSNTTIAALGVKQISNLERAPALAPDSQYDDQTQFTDASYERVMRHWHQIYDFRNLKKFRKGFVWADRFFSLAGKAAADGKQVMVFVSPAPVYFHGSLTYDRQLPGALLSAMKLRRGYSFPLFDLTTCLDKVARGGQSVMYGTNGHWSVAGNALVGRILSQNVLQLWLDAPAAAPTSLCSIDELEPRLTSKDQIMLQGLLK